MGEGAQIVWLKRDLRVLDHGPLFEAVQSGKPVLPLYIVEPDYWAQPFASQRHWAFVRQCLQELDADLKALGQGLIVRRGEACAVLNTLRQETGATTLWAHEETADLWTFERDEEVRRMCHETGLRFRELPANGVVRRLKNRDAWSRIRNQRMEVSLVPKPAQLRPVAPMRSDALPHSEDAMFGQVLGGRPQRGGRRAAVEDLRSFLSDRSVNYLRHISSPARSERSCSRLSTHIAWGSLSVREVVQALARRRAGLSPLEKKTFGRNLSAFGARLAWRCHFVQKLEDQPSLETQCMHPAFEGLREGEFRPDYFEAWCQGRTGFPFVDACMRSLIATGWITFRMRAMLVSFASYQLWLDWRQTAPYLARLFTDYEPGIHYSQFQMQSGVTGINAIRVYNPVKQGFDQDPDAGFIQKWVPELRGLSTQNSHEPWRQSEGLFDARKGRAMQYPPPIVDNARASKEAKDRIAAVRRTEAYRISKGAIYQRHGSRKRGTAASKGRAKRGKPPAQGQLDLFD